MKLFFCFFQSGQQFVHVVAGFGGKKHHRAVSQKRHALRRAVPEIGGVRRAVRHQVPFVDPHHAGAAFFVNQSAHGHIAFRQTFRRVHQEQRHLASLQRAFGHQTGQPFQIIGFGLFGAEPRGVNQEKLFVFPHQARIDGVPRCAGHRGNDHPFFAHQSIGEGGLPHVGAAHDGNANNLFLIVRFLPLRRRAAGQFFQGVQQMGRAPTVGRRQGDHRGKTQGGEIADHGVIPFRVGFVHGQNDAFGHGAEQAGKFLIPRGETFAGVRHPNDRVRTIDPPFDLGPHRRHDVRPGRVTSRVNQLIDPPVPMTKPLNPIARGPRDGRGNGATAFAETIEEGGFPHVGPTDENRGRQPGFPNGFNDLRRFLRHASSPKVLDPTHT